MKLPPELPACRPPSCYNARSTTARIREISAAILNDAILYKKQAMG